MYIRRIFPLGKDGGKCIARKIRDEAPALIHQRNERAEDGVEDTGELFSAFVALAHEGLCHGGKTRQVDEHRICIEFAPENAVLVLLPDQMW